MAKKILINGQEYETSKIQSPLASDTSQMVTFVDTTDADAAAADIKDGKSAYVDGVKVEGAMPVNGAGGGDIATKDGTVSIPEGYYDGSGKVAIADTEKAKLIPANVRQGVTVLGVEGTMSPSEGVVAQSKTVTPTKSAQVVQPDSSYTHLAQVTVEAIPVEYITTADANATAADIKSGKTGYVNGKKVTGTHTDPTFTLTSGVLTIS